VGEGETTNPKLSPKERKGANYPIELGGGKEEFEGVRVLEVGKRLFQGRKKTKINLVA